MKKLLFAIAGAAAFSAFAADPTPRTGDTGDISLVGFENFQSADVSVLEKDDSGGPNASYWRTTGDDASLVKAYGGDNAAAPGITEPPPFDEVSENTKYLAIDTNGGELLRLCNTQSNAVDVASTGTYIDTLVQFTPSESAPTDLDSDVKLAIWLDSATSNLMVAAEQYTSDTTSDHVSTNFVLVRANGDAVNPSTWYRLTVKAIPNVLDAGNADNEERIPAFQIYLNGELLCAPAALAPFTSGFIGVYGNGEEGAGYLTAAMEASLTERSVFPRIGEPLALSASATLTSVGFKGTGALDDFVVTTADPFPASAAIDFTLTWPQGVTPVSYTIDGGEAVTIDGNTTFPIQVADGAVVAFTFTNADGVTKTMTATASSSVDEIDASTATYVWADYLGDAVDGAYTIDNLADLILFQKGVAAGLATASTTFKLTDDIALTAAWEGIGIKAGKDLVNGDTKDIPAYEAGAFCGTFDGQNHTISNFQMENGTDYGAFFNSVNGALISNLKISFKENKLCANSSATGGDTGAAFVGVARLSTLQNLTALATQDVDTVSASKDMAGIVGYLMAGSTVDSCTNELNVASLLTAKARKSGGIALITQDGTGTATIQNCKNSGTVTLANAGGQSGGIVGYVGQSTTIIDCENTATVKMLTIMGGASLTVQGTNKGNATVASCNVATNGLNFATVVGSVATFVADTALAAGNTYKVLAPSATATYEFAAAGSISFDTNLVQAVTFAITAPGLDLTEATESGVVTFTAAAAATPLNPGEDDGETYATEEAAAEAAASVTIAAATEVATALGETEAANYVTNFEAKAVSNGAGGYTVQVVLKESVEAVLQDQANADAGTVAGALDAATATVTTTPGFYYSVKYGASLEAMNYRTAGELATGTSKALTMPAKPGASGFYKVVIDIAPSAAVAPAQE